MCLGRLGTYCLVFVHYISFLGMLILYKAIFNYVYQNEKQFLHNLIFWKWKNNL